MKKNKSYIVSALTLQMLLIPVLMTAGLIMMFSVFGGSAILQDLGRDTARLIFLIVAFIAPLVVGGVVGFIFKGNIKDKVTSIKGLYIASILPILYTLIFAMLVIAIAPRNYNATWWGVYALKNPALLIFHFILSFGGLHYLMIVAELMGYTGFALGMYLNGLVSKVDLHHNNSSVEKHWYALVLIIPMAFSSMITRDIINNGIIELRYGVATISTDLNEYDLYRIAPFKEDNGLAKLEQPASLQFHDFDTMPRLDGATAVYPVYAAFVEAVYVGLGAYYEENKNDYEKDIFTAFVSSVDYPLSIVQCNKTGSAYERLIQGETDIIFAAEPSKTHIQLLEEVGDAFVLTPIGSEAFVFFTNTQNPIDNLTIEEIQGIYKGEITNWREVGGPRRRIVPYQRPENSGSQTIMQNYVMRDVDMLEPTKETYAGGMGQIISQVANYKNATNAIGYSFMYYSSEMVKNNQIKHISINGIEPSPENIRNNTYPFTGPVYAITLKSNEDENVKKLLEGVQSEEGQSLVEQTGYVRNL